MAKIKFINSDHTFFATLKNRVENYFTENNIKPTGNITLFLKTIILSISLIACYTILVFFTPSNIFISLLLAAYMGINIAAIGFNVMHDGAHGSYSSKKWVNDLMGYSLNVLGANVYFWKQKHNINHHSYPNVEGMDDDIDILPLIRIHSGQKKYSIHRFQHYYSIFVYGIAYVFWIFFNDFNRYFIKRVSHLTPLRTLNTYEHFQFWFTKVMYITFFLAIPIYKVGLVNTLVAFGIMAFTAGVILSLIFQLAHVVEETKFITPDSDIMVIETEWAKHQLNTTSNFSTRSKFMTWFAGGLNFQVEHHLFPKISHVHYPVINKIVIQTCNEFNVNYFEQPNLLKAIGSHLNYLKQVGNA